MLLENSEQLVASAKSSANVSYCCNLTLYTHSMASEKWQQTCMPGTVWGQTQVEKKDLGTGNGNICHLPYLCSYVTGCEQISSLGCRSLNCEMRLLALPPAVKIKGYVSKRKEFHICSKGV